MKIRFLFTLFLCLALCTSSMAADNTQILDIEKTLDGSAQDFDIEDIMDGFDDTIDSRETVSAEPFDISEETPSFRDFLSGFFKISSAFNFAHKAPESGKTDYRGISRLRGELDLKLDFPLSEKWKARIGGNVKHDAAYGLNGRGNYTDAVLDDFETEAEFREIFIQGSLLADLDIKIGRQIVAWGTSESIRVIDILNPLDIREFGMVDIEDLRLPLAMTRLDYYSGRWTITGIAVHEIKFNKTPPYGSDFYPAESFLPPEKMPATAIKNTEFALAAIGRFSGWDLTFHAASFYNDDTHLKSDAYYTRMIQKHSRLNMLGSTIVAAKDNWLFKTEAAALYGFEFFYAPDDKKTRLDIMAGIEYAGFSETTITFEAVNRHLFGWNEMLSKSFDNTDEDEIQSVLRISRDFKNDTLNLTLLAGFMGETGQDGSFQRFSFEYDWTDDFKIIGGCI
ncbi:hypothetical protein QUF76_19115, partial [Desulfobacterales bacterium HSG16]|nr:hypothetical protein [Desulfobacterales bacterium HSG16]